MKNNNIKLMNKEIESFEKGDKNFKVNIDRYPTSFEIMDIYREKIGILEVIESIDNNNTQLSNLIVENRLYHTIDFLSNLYKDNKKVKRIFSLLLEWGENSIVNENIRANNPLGPNYKNDRKAFLNTVISRYPDELSLGFVFKYNSNINNNSAYMSQSKYKKRKYNFREQFIKFFSYNQLNELITIYKDKIDIHEFAENLVAINRKNFNEKFKEEYFKFLKKISAYNKTDNLKLLKFINYEKIRTAKNLSEMINHVNTINAAKAGIVNSKIIEPHMFTTFERRNYFWFNKELEEINSIGQRTICCFRKGGAAQSLLKPAYYSPIAGIIEGQLKDKAEWFSFVWETVEYNENNNTFEVSLVLDNLEATRKLKEDEMNNVLNMLKETKHYSKVYLGYLRNDIYQEYLDSIKHTIKYKERSLVCFEKEFEQYSTYDDSRQIFTIINNEDVPNSEIIVKKMNIGDLHRCKYVEWKLWEKHSDTDYVNDVILDNSYIIMDNKNIYGYIVTKKYWYNPKTNNIIYSSIKKSKNIEGEREDYVPLMYIDDIYMNKNKTFIKTLDKIFNEIIKYTKENNYQYYSCSCNKYSNPFLKRVPSNITFIRDVRYNNYDNINGITSEIQPLPSKVKFNKNVIYQF